MHEFVHIVQVEPTVVAIIIIHPENRTETYNLPPIYSGIIVEPGNTPNLVILLDLLTLHKWLVL